jgi:hypothetical protein
MRRPKAAKPATAAGGEPASKFDQLNGRVGFHATHPDGKDQAAGSDSDRRFFKCRPGRRFRLRRAFPAERQIAGSFGGAAKQAAAATGTVADGLAKIVAASQERHAAEDARQVQVIQEAMRRNGLVVTRTPAVAVRKMFEVGDDGVERYPDKQSVKVLIRSAVGEPDASIFLNWVDALDRMPVRKAATERSGAAFQGLLRRIERHPVTPGQAGLIRRVLTGGH